MVDKLIESGVSERAIKGQNWKLVRIICQYGPVVKPWWC